MQSRLNVALLAIAALGLVSGLILWALGYGEAAVWAWRAGVMPALVALVIEILRSLRAGEVGLDIVAALSMTAALVFDETLAAAVVAVMYSGGSFLESFAEGRARREMQDLLSRVPRSATLHRDGHLVEVALDAIAPGDLLLIRQGDVAPVDGTLHSARAVMDQYILNAQAPQGPKTCLHRRAACLSPMHDQKPLLQILNENAIIWMRDHNQRAKCWVL